MNMTTKKKNTKKASVSVSPTEIATTTEAGAAEVLQMKPSADILDMKLTRSELIELILEEVESDLCSQLVKAQNELQTVNTEVIEYFKNMSDDDLINNCILPEIRKYLSSIKSKNRLHLQYNLHFQYNNCVNFGYTYLYAKVPEIYTEKQTELHKIIDDIRQKMQKLTSKAGKLEIMKQMLSSSEEGQKLLAQIQGFKKSASAKLLSV